MMDVHVDAAHGSKGRRGALALGSAAVLAAAGTGVRSGVRAVRKRRGVFVGQLLRTGRGGKALSVTASDGIELHVEVDGPEDAPLTVVFVHGWTQDLSVWRHQRAALVDSPVRRVFVDQRGHGRSGRGKLGTADIRQLAEDLHTVLEAVVPTGPMVLAGHSMGGMTLTALARLHPELFGPRVKAALLVATSAGNLTESRLGFSRPLAWFIREHGPDTYIVLSQQAGLDKAAGLLPYLYIARKMCHRSASQETRRICAALLSVIPKDMMADYQRAIVAHDEYASLSVLGRVRTLVLAGADDKFIPKAHTDLLAELIPGAEHVVVAESGHMVQMEHPEVVNRHLAEVIASVSAPASDALAPSRAS
jgi:pimeloyl-ACP methyl ester carboxylesterase